MESENIPAGARRGADLVKQLLETLKRQDERITALESLAAVQQKLIADLCVKQEATDDSYLKLVTILQKSVVKIDESKLGLN